MLLGMHIRKGLNVRRAALEGKMKRIVVNKERAGTRQNVFIPVGKRRGKKPDCVVLGLAREGK